MRTLHENTILFRLYNIPQVTGVMAENRYWTLLEAIAERYKKSYNIKYELAPRRRTDLDEQRGMYFERRLLTRQTLKHNLRIIWIHP